MSIDPLALMATPLPPAVAAIVTRAAIDPVTPFEVGSLQHLRNLRASDSAGWERTRTELRKAGVRVGELDRQTKAIAPTAPNEGAIQGSILALDDPEPWGESVDLGEVLDEALCRIREVLSINDDGAHLLALWAAYTHVHDAFGTSTFLHVMSPAPECGKTLTLQVLHYLVARPLLVSDLTGAGLFRTIEAARGPTVLLDEAEHRLAQEDMAQLFRGAHTREGAKVVRCTGETFEPMAFNVWSPKAAATIGDPLDAALKSRFVRVNLNRRDGGGPQFDDARKAALLDVKRMLIRWAIDDAAPLKVAEPTLPAGLHNRRADLWRPLLAIAERAGDTWAGRARALALGDSHAPATTDLGTMLLADIRELFDARGVGRLASGVLTTELCALDGRPWSEMPGGRRLSPTRMANILRPFGIEPNQRRAPAAKGGTKDRGYDRADFEEAWRLYLPAAVATGTDGTDGT